MCRRDRRIAVERLLFGGLSCAPKAWLSQQRSEDYYNEGPLI
jgi:hypothetical protein